MRVILLGSYNPGVCVLRSLLKAGAEVAGVGTHAAEPESREWMSLYAEAVRHNIPAVKFKAQSKHEIAEFVSRSPVEVGFTIGFKYLLDKDVIAMPAYGWLNFHSSLLPRYRGRAPLNWAIINGEKELGVTLHFIDEGVDTGDIAFQERFTLSEEEDVGDALRKLYPLYEQLTICAIQGLQANALPRHPQDHSLATVFPKRTPDDGRIDWAWSATRVLNLTRALSKPYPGAFTSLDGRRLLIWKARIGHPTLLLGPRGSILDDGSVCCNPGILMVTNAEWEDDPGVRVDLAAFASSGFED